MGGSTFSWTTQGDVANAYMVIPELRGFEKFSQGRRVEELTDITPRICGVCPEAHHLASTKACDAVFHVDPPPTAKKLRELFYSAFYVADHMAHFYILGGPDFVMGPDAPVAERNILGVIHKVGVEIGTKVIEARGKAMDIIGMLGGRKIHPTFGLPGGVSKALNEEERKQVEATAKDEIEFALFTLQLFRDIVLANKGYLDLIMSPIFTMPTYYMGMVDEKNKVNFYDGKIRVVDPDGKEFVKYSPNEYLEHMAERVEPWTYLKFPYLKKVGWKGLVPGQGRGVYQATPLSRLNASDGMATPKAQEAYEEMYKTFGKKPVHNLLATHWARLIELLYAAERLLELATDPGDHRTPRSAPSPRRSRPKGWASSRRRGARSPTITSRTKKGIVTKANLIVGTTNNYAPISIAIKQAAQGLIKKGAEVTEGILNRVEMAFRLYDPCFGCATHTLPGRMPLTINVMDASGDLVRQITRGG